MNHVSPASATRVEVSSALPDDQRVEPVRPETFVTLSFFAVTAALLGLASLLSFGFVVSSAALSASMRVVLMVCVLVVASVAIAAMAYVYTLGKRYGIVGSNDDGEAEVAAQVSDELAMESTELPIVPAGLVVAPTVPPRFARRTGRRMADRRRSAARQARAIAAVASARDRGWPAPPTTLAPVTPTPASAAEDRGRPMPTARPMTPAPTSRPPSPSRPSARTPMDTPVGPQQAPVPALLAPVHARIRPGPPPAGPRGPLRPASARLDAMALQLRMAGLPAPDHSPRRGPNLVERLRGPTPVPPVPLAAPRRSRAIPRRTPARPGSAQPVPQQVRQPVARR